MPGPKPIRATGHIGDLLRRLEDEGYTSADIARATGAHATSVSRWRAGREVPGDQYIAVMADLAGVELAWVEKNAPAK